MIKMIKTRIPIAMGTTPPRMPFASYLFAPAPCVLWSKQKAQAPILTQKNSPATGGSNRPSRAMALRFLRPCDAVYYRRWSATACLVVRSWQQRLDLLPGLVCQLVPSAIPSHLLYCRDHLKRRLAEAEPICVRQALVDPCLCRCPTSFGLAGVSNAVDGCYSRSTKHPELRFRALLSGKGASLR